MSGFGVLGCSLGVQVILAGLRVEAFLGFGIGWLCFGVSIFGV